MNIDLNKYVFGEIIEYRESFINIPIKDNSSGDGSIGNSEKKLIGVYIINKVIWYGLHFLYRIQSDGKIIKIKICESDELEQVKSKLTQFSKVISHGDIIVCPRPILNHNINLYTHWAIYDERKGLVLEYAFNDSGSNCTGSGISGSGFDLLNKCILTETKIDEFLEREHWIHTFTNSDDGSITPDQVVERARDLINSGQVKNYNVLTRNCQHFATFCKYGKSYSKDLSNKLRILNLIPDCYSEWRGSLVLILGIIAAFKRDPFS